MQPDHKVSHNVGWGVTLEGRGGYRRKLVPSFSSDLYLARSLDYVVDVVQILQVLLQIKAPPKQRCALFQLGQPGIVKFQSTGIFALCRSWTQRILRSFGTFFPSFDGDSEWLQSGLQDRKACLDFCSPESHPPWGHTCWWVI